jgi:hypothetical protein
MVTGFFGVYGGGEDALLTILVTAQFVGVQIGVLIGYRTFLEGLEFAVLLREAYLKPITGTHC